MIGSEKQVVWAEKIKNEFIEKANDFNTALDAYMSDGFDQNPIAATNIPAAQKTVKILQQKLEAVESAKFFIEVVNKWEFDTYELEDMHFANMDKFFKRVLNYFSCIKKGKLAPTTIITEEFIKENDIVIDESWK